MDNRTDAQWYYKVAGQEYGPVSTDELISLVRLRKLFAEDLVRLEAAGPWFFAGELDELFSVEQEPTHSSALRPLHPRSKPSTNAAGPKSGQPKHRSLNSKARNAADAASDLLDHVHSRQFEDETELCSSGLVRSIFRRMASVPVSAVEHITSARDYLLENLSLLRRLLRLKSALIICGVLLLVALMRFVPISWRSAADAEMTYAALWTELKEYRQSEANDAVWAEFSVRANNELTPIVKRLEQNASATDQRSLALLWAGRDYFPRMLFDARKEVSESERKFERQLVTAQRLADRERSKTSDREPITSVILTFDVCIVVAFLVFIMHKRWS